MNNLPAGLNPCHGLDTGSAPPEFYPAQAAGVPQYPGYPGFFGGQPQGFGYGWPAPPAYPGFGGFPGSPQQQVVQQWPQQQPFMRPYGGFGMGGQWPAFPPNTDGGFPGINLKNETGGVGLPPGYNYCFPAEHCKIHVFKTKEKPWQKTLWSQDTSTHVKLYVPTTTSIKELMQNLGCDNKDAAKNILYEVVESGGGRWKIGSRFPGDDKDKIKKSISDYGWRADRTGAFGEKPVVWLWVTKDGQ